MPPAVPGPLAGLRVLELASLAPAPFACTILSDLGAQVLRIDRPSAMSESPPAPPPPDPLARGRRSVAVDLKHPQGAETVLRLAEQTDVFVEGFRPGVCERLGIGPDECRERNPRLIYARMTGYGQDGPMAQRAGHDINYLSLAGALEPIGPSDAPPLPPINYVADFGGGGMLLVVGILAALWERERSGLGQVIDAAMVEGAALITSVLHTLHGAGLWHEQRGGNLFDGSAPFYATYECADGKYVAVGALEPQFWAALLDGLGLAGPDTATQVAAGLDSTNSDSARLGSAGSASASPDSARPDAEMPDQFDRDRWPEAKRRIADVFRTRTRAEWAAIFAESDACVTPVLSPFEAHEHPHNIARGTFADVAGQRQPAPAPRFSRTPGRIASPAPHAGQHTDDALLDWGFSPKEIETLHETGTVR